MVTATRTADELTGSLDRLRTVAVIIAQFLIGSWLGAALFFSFAVAPAAFAVLLNRELAGALVSRTLSVVNIGGFLISITALVIALLFLRPAGRVARITELVSLITLAAMTGIGQWVIGARLHAIRAQLIGPIESLAQDDPVRQAFGALHGYSVIVLMIAMVAALVAFITVSRKRT